MAERHTGKLAKPIVVDDTTTKEEVASIVIEKLEELRAFYGIEDNPDKWFILSVELAERYVPGFRVVQAKRKQPKSVARDLILFLELSAAESLGPNRLSQAARRLARAHPLFDDVKPEYLRQRYYRLKNPRTPEGQNLDDLIGYIEAKGGAFLDTAKKLVLAKHRKRC